MMGQPKLSSAKDYTMHSFLLFGGMNNDKDDNITTAMIIVTDNRNEENFFDAGGAFDDFLLGNEVNEKLPEARFKYICQP